MSNLTRAGEVYVVNNEVNNEGVPFADSFYISVHICIVRVSAADVQDDVIAGVTEWCQYSCYSSVQYKKSVWGVLKGQLERATYSGMEGIHRDVAAALRDYAIGSMSASDVRAAKAIGQNARKKKRSKTTSSDFGHSNKKTKDDAQRISWAHGILNTSLVLSALLLVVLNVNLFAKVQYLETVSKNLTLASHCPALLATPFTDQLLTSDPNSDDPQEIWELVKNLLASQKASYSAELQQMGSHLLQATRALDQADSELHIVLDRLPHSLDVLADAVKEHIREEQVMGKISDVFKRIETRQLDNKAQT
ncbi:uncharacterized protein LOC108666943 isoform X1 [Hyalella azteca]|uniref:Uncharacterized protein LOC108666943 isoform X1 n=1 Tax=Hyalella azteca TaxID=294128 RepID=A0A8B7N829_HYAAZ|nr:uncharacterized protein LOC108666943 isoform X1 [Hyalella azteca]